MTSTNFLEHPQIDTVVKQLWFDNSLLNKLLPKQFTFKAIEAL